MLGWKSLASHSFGIPNRDAVNTAGNIAEFQCSAGYRYRQIHKTAVRNALFHKSFLLQTGQFGRGFFPVRITGIGRISQAYRPKLHSPRESCATLPNRGLSAVSGIRGWKEFRIALRHKHKSTYCGIFWKSVREELFSAPCDSEIGRAHV